MSKLLQRGASAALRVRAMSSEVKLSPEKVAEYGSKLNPTQAVYGPKSEKVEKWQKFFQDPINVEKPMYRRKGATDDIQVAAISVAVAGIFVYNVVDFFFM